MGLSSEITALTTYTSNVERDLTNIKTALNNKGVSTSSSTKLGDVPGLIAQVKTGQNFKVYFYIQNNSPYFTDCRVYDAANDEPLGDEVTIKGYSSGTAIANSPRRRYKVVIFPYGGPSSMVASTYWISHETQMIDKYSVDA